MRRPSPESGPAVPRATDDGALKSMGRPLKNGMGEGRIVWLPWLWSFPFAAFQALSEGLGPLLTAD